ncbi:MAG: hypothetical protein IRZ28_20145 [Steroidobacteraceae bacterium]|nr:hypothetical protein [Steroidobacteraceae bacterium]
MSAAVGIGMSLPAKEDSARRIRIATEEAFPTSEHMRALKALVDAPSEHVKV